MDRQYCTKNDAANPIETAPMYVYERPFFVNGRVSDVKKLSKCLSKAEFAQQLTDEINFFGHDITIARMDWSFIDHSFGNLKLMATNLLKNEPRIIADCLVNSQEFGYAIANYLKDTEYAYCPKDLFNYGRAGFRYIYRDVLPKQYIYETSFHLNAPVTDQWAANVYLKEQTDLLLDDLRLQMVGVHRKEIFEHIEDISWELETDDSGYIQIYSSIPISDSDLEIFSRWAIDESVCGLGERFAVQWFSDRMNDWDPSAFDWITETYHFRDISDNPSKQIVL